MEEAFLFWLQDVMLHYNIVHEFALHKWRLGAAEGHNDFTC